jgi:hypothetical protein
MPEQGGSLKLILPKAKGCENVGFQLISWILGKSKIKKASQFVERLNLVKTLQIRRPVLWSPDQLLLLIE